MEPRREKPKVAVVVASSRVGSSAVKELAGRYADDVHVRAVLRSKPQEQDGVIGGTANPGCEWPSQVEVVYGFDVENPTTHAPAFSGITRAFLVAPKLENRDQVVNKMITAAAAHGVRRVVLIGGVFQEEERFLFHRHWMSSRRHAETIPGLAWTQLECADFMENLLGQKASIKSDGCIYGGGADGCSCPIALDDIGRAAAAVLADSSPSHDNRAYRMTGPEALSPEGVAQRLGEGLGKLVRFVDRGVEEYYQEAARSGAMSAWQARGMVDWMRLYFVTNRFREVSSDLLRLGVQPTSLKDWAECHRVAFSA